ncbi:polyprenol reductase [Teleopsis dalmanni]|uniref:polyprenol reductase n=1 Tax=Teleopsis dalmanni TaxID=139649 RepID=UPI0018CE274F|nr:polyprenol reductase [Teleopsis dalmanni]
MLLKLIQQMQEFIDEYNINLIHAIFIGFTILIVIFGSLMNLIEQHLPLCIRQSFRYGKHCHVGSRDPLVTKLEVPKSWFKHFYVFAFTWSVLALFLVLKVLILRAEAPEFVLQFLDFMAGGAANRKVQVDSTSALVVSILMTLQCGRRFYETNFIQIFSKKSKINFSHYMVGYIHYFGVILALLANTEGFVRDTLPSQFSYAKITLLQYLCVFIFHFSWTQQYKSNMILVNLRKNPQTGEVSTEKHLLPRGGFFNLISSPHMFFEIVMYAVLLSLLPRCTSWYFIVFWVLSNQTMNALLTHKWYKDNFKDYPKNRRALFPFVL